MAVLITPALVCGVRSHGEHGAIARLLTPDQGLLAGYVRGGRSRASRPVLLPGNSVKAEFRARTEEQLAGLTVELEHSRARNSAFTLFPGNSTGRDARDLPPRT
jgi:DNA repair protein RecO (recombination protein O)